MFYRAVNKTITSNYVFLGAFHCLKNKVSNILPSKLHVENSFLESAASAAKIPDDRWEFSTPRAGIMQKYIRDKAHKEK